MYSLRSAVQTNQWIQLGNPHGYFPLVFYNILFVIWSFPINGIRLWMSHAPSFLIWPTPASLCIEFKTPLLPYILPVMLWTAFHGVSPSVLSIERGTSWKVPSLHILVSALCIRHGSISSAICNPSSLLCRSFLRQTQQSCHHIDTWWKGASSRPLCFSQGSWSAC